MSKKNKKKRNKNTETIIKEQKSVILTVKDDGKLAVAAHEDGSIAYIIDEVEEEVLTEKGKEAARKKAEKEARKKAKKEARQKAREARRARGKKPVPAAVPAPAVEEIPEEAPAVTEPMMEAAEPVSEVLQDQVINEEPAESITDAPEIISGAVMEENAEETPAAEVDEPVEEVSAETEEPVEEATEEPSEETVAEEAPAKEPEAEVPAEVSSDDEMELFKDEPIEEAEAEAENLAIAVSEGSMVPVSTSEVKAMKPFLKGLIAAAIVFVIGAGGWITYDYFIPKQVTVIIETLEQTQQINAEVKAQNVADALRELDVPVSDIDSVQPFLNERLSSSTTINVTKRLESSATIAGEEQKFILVPGTVEENLAFNEIEYDSDDIITPALTAEMDSTSKIEVKDVVKVVKEKEKTIAYKSKIILDPSIASGTKKETVGKDGTAIYTYTTTYINGEKEGTEKEFKEWIEEPVDNTVRLGTSVTGESGEVTIVRSFISNTTAYYCGSKARGATGRLCHYGTIAVDPRVFPYGSRFWIAGYGYAVATDCGGAIKGTKTDLYMRSLKECYRWGRRYVQAYLLG